MPERVDDEVYGSIRNGLGAGGRGVAVDDASFREAFDVDPVRSLRLLRRRSYMTMEASR